MIKIFHNVFLVKTLLYIAILIPLFEIIYSIYNSLFFDPVDEILAITGINTLRLLIVALSITPLADISGWKKIYIYRRMIGVSAFCYIALHALVWAFGQELNLNYMITDIIKHKYIIVGLVSAVILLVLAITSMDWVIRLMGFYKWKKLHLLTYPAVFLGALHYLMQDKSGFSKQPYVYMGIIVLLLLYRFFKICLLSAKNK